MPGIILQVGHAMADIAEVRWRRQNQATNISTMISVMRSSVASRYRMVKRRLDVDFIRQELTS